MSDHWGEWDNTVCRYFKSESHDKSNTFKKIIFSKLFLEI